MLAGADVRLVAAVGDGADEALALLRAEGVDLTRVREVDGPTGLALIEVDERGETTIVVVPGANARLTLEPADVAAADAVLTVLEVPDDVVRAAAEHTTGLLVLNAAPARAVDPAVLRRGGREVARASPPPVTAVDGTAAGDAVVATAVLGMLDGLDDTALLARACAAGALAATRHGAQPSLPTAPEIDEVLRR